MDSNGICILTLLDLSSSLLDFSTRLAFLAKLVLVLSYHSNRTQVTTMIVCSFSIPRSAMAFPRPVSVLGLVLFIRYAHPLIDQVSNHTISHHAFADDKQFYKIITY